MVGIISTRIMGETADADRLSAWLSDPARLRRIVDGLSEKERSVLSDIFELGSQMEWHVFLRIYRQEITSMRAILERLGERGLVFQAGLSGRDPIILLPSLSPVMADIRSEGLPDAAVSWKDVRPVSIWPHIVMLNALRTVKIRCRPGMEPFKKGWELLEERLGAFIEIRRIYWELEMLSCVRESNGAIEVLQGPAQEFAMEGELRYRVWRFLQACRPYPGLDARIMQICGARGLGRETFERALFFYLAQHFPEMDAIEHTPAALISLWLELGILQEDVSGKWIRIQEEIYQALESGKLAQPITAYRDEVIIQPNMEILVPQDFDPLDHLNIGEIADLVQADVISIYRLSRTSVFRAVREGWTADKLTNFLDRIAKHAVPENVLKTIAGWATSLSQAHIIRGTFLVINNCRDKIPHGLDEVLPGIYRIPERCEDEVVTFLDRKSVIIQRTDRMPEQEGAMNWGRSLPLQIHGQAELKPTFKGGIYPFGMLIPLPYGHKGIEIFEQAAQQGQSLVILYPKHGYGEMQVYQITPVYITTKGGVSFVEAVNEESGETEVFDISKVRALLKREAVIKPCKKEAKHAKPAARGQKTG
ncbi:MAG TPA: helicase-associated domain-containing protein [Deltaproteobacteria bacterium]|nr:helicase-associated domain-containing protein [Deltaproteobacteria bacterium]